MEAAIPVVDASARKPFIHSLSKAEISAVLEAMSLPSYRAKQVWQWLYIQRAHSWDEMLNLPAALRKELALKFDIAPVSSLKAEGEPGETRKILVGLRDGEMIEEVLIPAVDRRTVCISSQAGCRFNCAFCASGKSGFIRNLEPAEMVGQVLLGWEAYGERPTNVVVMGVGEPFDNYDAVLKALRIINDQDGLSIGARKITISTSGVIPGIKQLAEEGLQVEMSVSLHAPNDSLRSELMPVNKKYPLASLLAACSEYFEKTNRLITFEYTLVKDVNDKPEHARELAGILSAFPCRVNLIPLSPVDEYDGEPSSAAAADGFIRTLEKAGINATLRSSKGGSLQAACGQLRSRHAAS